MIRSRVKIAKMIDHTNVKPDATQEDIERLCSQSGQYGFSCACVTPTNVEFAKKLLKNFDINVCAVIGFPLGATTSKTKAFETREAIEKGASELDMVMNIGALKSGIDEEVKDDISGVVEAADGHIVKVILETGLLNENEKIKACKLSMEARADYVKTSTGFGVSGATLDDIRLIKEVVGTKMGIKASGGIRDLKTALDMIEAGATRIGTSSGVQIMEELLK